jgi:hypothetical protein
VAAADRDSNQFPPGVGQRPPGRGVLARAGGSVAARKAWVLQDAVSNQAPNLLDRWPNGGVVAAPRGRLSHLDERRPAAHAAGSPGPG